MSPRIIVLFLVAAVAAGGAVFGARTWLQAREAALLAANQPQEQVVSDTIEILVASVPLPAGRLLKEDHLEWKPWPEDALTEEHVLRDPDGPKGQKSFEAFVGTVVRRGMVKGEPVLEAYLVEPGSRGFLAAVLDPGMRAITVPVDNVSGIAGFVFPGDRVDVVLTHHLKEKEKDKFTVKAAETVLSNVRVLAIDQSTDDQAETAAVSEVVTLEVFPRQVEVVKLLTEMGKLSLALRSLQAADADDEREPHEAAVTQAAHRVIDSRSGLQWPANGRMDPGGVEGGPSYSRSLTINSQISPLIASPLDRPIMTQVEVARGSNSNIIQFYYDPTDYWAQAAPTAPAPPPSVEEAGGL